MKRVILILIVWYFAFGRDILTFEKFENCKSLNDFYKGNGYRVSECESGAWPPNVGHIKQQSNGTNSPNIVGGKGDVIINGEKVKK